MPKQNQFSNRLNDLFADMGDEQSEISAYEAETSGWIWECDSAGLYQTCGPEVVSVLGVEPAAFLGQPLTSFLLATESAQLLRDTLEKVSEFPIEITLQFQNPRGSLVPVRTHIFQNQENHWRGFSQVVESGSEPIQPIPPEKPVKVEPAPTLSTAMFTSATSFGIAMDDDRPISISSPYSGAGKQSLKQRQTISNPSAPGVEAALAVPISMPNQSLGLLEIIDPSPNRDWSEDEQRLVEEVANQLALALENAQLFQETQSSLARTDALFRVGQAAIAFENLVQLLQSVVDTIAEVLPATRSLVAVIDQQNQTVPYFLESHAPPIPTDAGVYDELMNGLTGWAIRKTEPALSNAGTVDPRETEKSWEIRQQSDAGSILVVPMIYRDEPFGTITAINSFSRPGFTQSDVDLLLAMANQVATALANNQLFQQVTSRSEELALVNRIVTQITGSLDIEENLRTIAAEIGKSFGVQVNIGMNNASKTQMRTVAFYSPNPNTPDSIGNETEPWTSSEVLILRDVQKDPNLAANRNLYRQSGIFSLATFPIMIGNEILGAIEIDIIEPNRDFSDDEIRLIRTILTQAATAIQSARIFQEEQRRRRIAATLSDIARVIGGSLDLQQIAERLLARLSDVLDFNTATLQIIEGDQRHRIGGMSRDGQNRVKDRKELLRPISEDPLIRSVVESKQPLVLSDTHVHPLWDPLPETADVRSWIATPLLRGDEVIGLLILDHTLPNAYDDETSDLLSAIAAQAAVALHNARLYLQAQDRSRQLQTAAEVSRAASSILDPNPLITQTVNLILERFDLYYVGLFLIDEHGLWTREPGRWAVLRAGTGDAGRIQVERNHKLEIGGTSMVGKCIASAQPQISQQVSIEDQRFVNPLLPETRSEMALPLISRNQVIGAMSIQSTSPAAFTDEDIVILQTMADQVANALQNANLFDQTQARAEELAVLNEMSRQLTATVDVNTITRNIYLFTSRLIDTSTFFIALYDEATDTIEFPLATEENQEIKIKSRKKGQGLTEYVLNQRESLHLHEDVEGWLRSQGVELIPIGREEEENDIAQSWLGVPMLAGDLAIGVIGVQNNEPHHYTEQDHDLLIGIASQGAIAFQNARLFAETRQRTEDLAILNEMSANLSNQLDISNVVETIHEYTSRLMDTNNIFIALYDASKDEVSFPLTINGGERFEADTRKLGSGMTDYMLRNRRTLLLNGDLLPQMKALGIEFLALGDDNVAKSFLGTPLIISNQAIGVIALQSVETPFLYQERQRDLLVAIASQAAIAIQNAELFNETSQRTEDLAVLNEMSRVLASVLEINAVANTIYEYTSKLMDTTNFFLSLYEAETDEISTPLVIINHEKIELPTRSLGNGLSDYVLRNHQALLLNGDVNAQQAQLGIASIPIGKGIPPQSWLGVPMLLGDRVIGVISVQSLITPFLYQERQRDLLGSIAGQAAITIQNTRLFDQTQKQLVDLSTISNATQTLSSAPLETHSVAEIITRIFIDVFGGNATASITLRESEISDQMVTLASLTKIDDEIRFEENLRKWDYQLKDYPATQRVIETLESLVVNKNDLNADPAELAFMELSTAHQLIIIPLAVKRQAIGVLELEYYDEIRKPTSEELTLVMTLANQAAIALENARLYEEQRETAEQLREVDTLKSQFLANMSHELRTPLNSIIGFSRVIMKGIDGPVSDLQQQDLSAIYNAGQHLLTMINDILDISKIEAGKMELAFDDVDISGIVDSVLSTARGLVKDKPVKLVTVVEEGLPIITADPTRIRQILLNLISNASKFTDEGSITVTVRKQTSVYGKKELYLAVTDTGAGIAEADQNKLFMPFSQVDGSPTRKVGGTGLGLSITRLLVELHGGEIGVTSAEGQGSTFWFTIPLPEGSEGLDNPNLMTVLAIDDDTQVISLYQRYLSNAGYDVIALTDPHLALEEARKVKPFVITLDIMMPDFDGWKLLESLKSDPEVAQIPVVICSILAEYDKGKKLGAADYLVKPILEDELVGALSKLRPPQY